MYCLLLLLALVYASQWCEDVEQAARTVLGHCAINHDWWDEVACGPLNTCVFDLKHPLPTVTRGADFFFWFCSAANKGHDDAIDTVIFGACKCFLEERALCRELSKFFGYLYDRCTAVLDKLAQFPFGPGYRPRFDLEPVFDYDEACWK